MPCILCQGESQPTLVGDHWKCSVCAHIFNKDSSDIGVDCYCDSCQEKAKVEHEAKEALQKLLAEQESKEEPKEKTE